MARIHVDIPSDFLFSTNLTIRVTDLNYGKHVGNDTVLSLFHEIRIRFYRSLGYTSELNIEGEIGQIVTDAAIVYKAEAFLGDVITGKLAITEMSKYGFDLVYQLTNKETGKEVARGKTGIVFFNYENRKVAIAPVSFIDKIKMIKKTPTSG